MAATSMYTRPGLHQNRRDASWSIPTPFKIWNRLVIGPTCLVDSTFDFRHSRKRVTCYAKRPSIMYVCSKCGQKSLREYGRCPSCMEFNTMQEQVEAPETTNANTSVLASVEATVKRQQKRKAKTSSPEPSGDDDSVEDVSLAAVSSMRKDSRGRSQTWLEVPDLSIDGPKTLADLKLEKRMGRAPQRMILTGQTGREVNRVLGGGVVPGSLVLIGGEPGVGKSTLSLQVAAMIAQPDLDFDTLADKMDAATTQSIDKTGSFTRQRLQEDDEDEEGEDIIDDEDEQDGLPLMSRSLARKSRRVLYVSGEETDFQIFERAARMGLDDLETLHLKSSDPLERIMEEIIKLRPAAVVVDSLQTMFLQRYDNPAGAPFQLKECCSELMKIAKKYGIAVIAIGQVTKQRDIAGPMAVEHMVDTVLKLEGDMSQSYRIMRVSKNRFGSTDEVGVFCMDRFGMHAVLDPTAMFLANRSSGSSAVAVVMDGTRVLVMEVQALVTAVYAASHAPPVRQATGANKDRVIFVIVNVLHKFVMKMSAQNVVVNVTGGMQMKEAAADLAIAVAITASYYNIPVPTDTAAIGEIDLGGGLRPVRGLDLRVLELAKLGLKRIIVPEDTVSAKLQKDPRLAGQVDIVRCKTLLQALQEVLGPEVGQGKREAGRSRSSSGANAQNGGDVVTSSGAGGSDGRYKSSRRKGAAAAARPDLMSAAVMESSASNDSYDYYDPDYPEDEGY